MLTDKQAYWAHVILVLLSMLIASVSWTTYFGPTAALGITQALVVFYGVMGFIANGVTPPAPPVGGK